MRQLTDNFLELQVKRESFEDQNTVLELQINPQGETWCELFCVGFPLGLSTGVADIRLDNGSIIFENTKSQQMMKFLLDNKDQKIVAEILSKLWKEYTGKARLGGFGRKSLILSFQKLIVQGDEFSVRFGKRAGIKRIKSKRFAKCTSPKK